MPRPKVACTGWGYLLPMSTCMPHGHLAIPVLSVSPLAGYGQTGAQPGALKYNSSSKLPDDKQGSELLALGAGPWHYLIRYRTAYARVKEAAGAHSWLVRVRNWIICTQGRRGIRAGAIRISTSALHIPPLVERSFESTCDGVLRPGAVHFMVRSRTYLNAEVYPALGATQAAGA